MPTRDVARCSSLKSCASAHLPRWSAAPYFPHPLAVCMPPALFSASLPPTLHPRRTTAPTHRSSLPSSGPPPLRVTHVSCSGYAPLLGVFPAVGAPLPPTLRHVAAHRSRLVACGPSPPLWLRRGLRRRRAEQYLPYPLAACAPPAVRCGASRRGCVPLGRRRRRAAPHFLLVVPRPRVQPIPPAASARWRRRVVRPIIPVVPPPPPASNADCASGELLPSFRPCPLDMPLATEAPTRRSPLPFRASPPSPCPPCGLRQRRADS